MEICVSVSLMEVKLTNKLFNNMPPFNLIIYFKHNGKKERDLNIIIALVEKELNCAVGAKVYKN